MQSIVIESKVFFLLYMKDVNKLLHVAVHASKVLTSIIFKAYSSKTFVCTYMSHIFFHINLPNTCLTPNVPVPDHSYVPC